MNESELSRIDDSKYNGVITPIKREKKIYENPLIIGFDANSYSYSLGGILLGETLRYLSLHFHKDGETRSYFTNDIYWPEETPHYSNGKYKIEVLTDYIFQFLSELKIDSDTDCIYLVTHYAHDELSHFEIPKDFKVRPISKGLCLEGKIKNISLDTEIKLNIIDLYSLLNKSLTDIGNYIDLPRVTGDELFGRLNGLRIENLDLSLIHHCDIFENHSLMDSQIPYEAYIKLRSDIIDNHNIDLLNFYTLPSLAGYIFRRDHINKPIVRSKTIKEARKQKKTLSDGDEKYYDVLQPKEIFNGDLNVRKCSILAHHGGRIETFCRGRFEDKRLIYYDVDSLYPSSSILQPLPLAKTRWIKYSKRNAEKFLNQAEGFVELEFSYSPDTFYPCLPLLGLRDDILYFPLSGITYCTISELRMAIKLGLRDYKIVDGHGFYPTQREKEHPLAGFMKDMLERKHPDNGQDRTKYCLYRYVHHLR